jgi:DNA repair exonuclease SbcCD ATPase subunit
MKKTTAARSPSPQQFIPETYDRRNEDSASPGLNMMNSQINQSTDLFVLNETGSTNNIKLLREYYTTAKSLSSELANATNLSLPLRIHSQQASRVYSALSTLLYSSISIAKADELERYVRKKAAQLPRSLIDMEQWVYVLQIAKDCREGPENRAILQELEMVKHDSRALLYSAAVSTRNTGNDWKKLKDDVESQLSSMQQILDDAKSAVRTKLLLGKGPNKVDLNARPKSAAAATTTPLLANDGPLRTKPKPPPPGSIPRKIAFEELGSSQINADSVSSHDSGNDHESLTRQLKELKEKETVNRNTIEDLKAQLVAARQQSGAGLEKLTAESGQKDAKIKALEAEVSRLRAQVQSAAAEAENGSLEWKEREAGLKADIDALLSKLGASKSISEAAATTASNKLELIQKATNATTSGYEAKLKSLEGQLEAALSNIASSASSIEQKSDAAVATATIPIAQHEAVVRSLKESCEQELEKLREDLAAIHIKNVGELKSAASVRLRDLDDRHVLEHETALTNFHKSVTDMNQRHHHAMAELRESLAAQHAQAIEELTQQHSAELSEVHEARLEELSTLEEMALRVDGLQEREQAAIDRIAELESSEAASLEQAAVLQQQVAELELAVTSLRQQLDSAKLTQVNNTSGLKVNADPTVPERSASQLENQGKAEVVETAKNGSDGAFPPPVQPIPSRVSAVEKISSDDISAYYENILAKIRARHKRDMQGLVEDLSAKKMELERLASVLNVSKEINGLVGDALASSLKQVATTVSEPLDQDKKLQQANNEIIADFEYKISTLKTINLQEVESFKAEIRSLTTTTEKLTSENGNLQKLIQEHTRAQSDLVVSHQQAFENARKEFDQRVSTLKQSAKEAAMSGKPNAVQSALAQIEAADLTRSIASQAVSANVSRGLQSAMNTSYKAQIKDLEKSVTSGQEALDMANSYAAMNIRAYDEQIAELQFAVQSYQADVVALKAELNRQKELLAVAAVDARRSETGRVAPDSSTAQARIDQLNIELEDKTKLMEAITAQLNDKLVQERLNCEALILESKESTKKIYEQQLLSIVDTINKTNEDCVLKLQIAHQNELEQVQRRVIATNASHAKDLCSRHVIQIKELKSSLEKAKNDELELLRAQHTAELAASRKDKSVLVEQHAEAIKTLKKQYETAQQQKIEELSIKQDSELAQLKRRLEREYQDKARDLEVSSKAKKEKETAQAEAQIAKATALTDEKALLLSRIKDLEGKVAAFDANGSVEAALKAEIGQLLSANSTLADQVQSLGEQLAQLQTVISSNAPSSLLADADSLQLQADNVDNLLDSVQDITAAAAQKHPQPVNNADVGTIVDGECLRVGLGDDSLEDVVSGVNTRILDPSASLESIQRRAKGIVQKLKQISSGKYMPGGENISADVQTIQMNQLKELEGAESRMKELWDGLTSKNKSSKSTFEGEMASIFQSTEDSFELSPEALDIVGRLKVLTSALVSEQVLQPENSDYGFSNWKLSELSQISTNIAEIALDDGGSGLVTGNIPLFDAETDSVVSRAKNLIGHLMKITDGVSNAQLQSVQQPPLTAKSPSSSRLADSLCIDVQQIQRRVEATFTTKISKLIDDHLMELESLSTLNTELTASKIQQLQLQHRRDVESIQTEFDSKFKEIALLWSIVRESYDCELLLLRRMAQNTAAAAVSNVAASGASNASKKDGKLVATSAAVPTSSQIRQTAATVSAKIVATAVNMVRAASPSPEARGPTSPRESVIVSKLRDNESTYLKQIEKQLADYGTLTGAYELEKNQSTAKSKRIQELEKLTTELQKEIDSIRSKLSTSVDEIAQLQLSKQENSVLQQEIDSVRSKLNTSVTEIVQLQQSRQENVALLDKLTEEQLRSTANAKRAAELEELLKKAAKQRDEAASSGSAVPARAAPEPQQVAAAAATNIARVFSPLVIDTVLKSRKENSAPAPAAAPAPVEVPAPAPVVNAQAALAEKEALQAEIATKLSAQYNDQLSKLHVSLVGEKDRIVAELSGTIDELKRTLASKERDIDEKSALLEQVIAQTTSSNGRTNSNGSALLGDASVYEGSQDGSTGDVVFRELSIDSAGSALRRINDDFRQLQQSEPYREKCAVRMQALLRGFNIRNRMRRNRMAELAMSQGVLVAIPGTKQGRTGWYESGGLFFYFVLDKV